MEPAFLHCRSFGRDPRGLVVYERPKKAPETAAGERPAEGFDASKTAAERSTLSTAIETGQLTSEFKKEVIRSALQGKWEKLRPEERAQLQPFIDQMERAIRDLNSYAQVEKNAKDKGKVYEAVKNYEWGARAFNAKIGSKIFPENLTPTDWKSPKDAKKEDAREQAFSRAREMHGVFNVNYTDNPSLKPAVTAESAEKKEPKELGFKEIEELAKGPVVHLREMVKELKDNKKKLKLTLPERTKLTTTALSPGIEAAREHDGDKKDHPIALLRNHIILDTWYTHVEALVGAQGKFDLKPDDNFGRVITKNPEERTNGPIFSFVPKEGQTPSPEETAQAQECREFLDANWRDVVYTFKNKRGVDLMQKNVDVVRNNQEMERVYKDIRGTAEFEAFKKQPFSRMFVSSPMGIILVVLAYFKPDSWVTKALLGTYGTEKIGGLPGLQALYNQAGDQVPWLKQFLDDIKNGNVGLKAKEYSRGIFEKWTGLEGIEKGTQDWMLEDSDGLSSMKKIGIYMMLNDQKVGNIRSMMAAPANSSGSIGLYIKEWHVAAKGGWATGTGIGTKVKNTAKRLATTIGGAGAKTEHAIEQFLAEGIAGIDESDIRSRFFAPKIMDKGGKPNKDNPMYGTLQNGDANKEFEVELKNLYPDTGGGAKPSGGIGSAPTGSAPAAPSGTVTGAPPPAPVAGTAPSAAPLASPLATPGPTDVDAQFTAFKPEGAFFTHESIDIQEPKTFTKLGSKITYTTFSYPSKGTRFVIYQKEGAPVFHVRQLADPRKSVEEQFAKPGNVIDLTAPIQMKTVVQSRFGRIVNLHNERMAAEAAPVMTADINNKIENFKNIIYKTDYFFGQVMPAFPGYWEPAEANPGDNEFPLRIPENTKIAHGDNKDFIDLYIQPKAIPAGGLPYLAKVSIGKEPWRSEGFIVTKVHTGLDGTGKLGESVKENGSEVTRFFESISRFKTDEVWIKANFKELFDAPAEPATPATPEIKPENVSIADTTGKTLEQLGTDGMVTAAGTVWRGMLAELKVKDAVVENGYSAGKNASITFKLDTGTEFRATVVADSAKGEYVFDVRSVPAGTVLFTTDIPQAESGNATILIGTAKGLAANVPK